MTEKFFWELIAASRKGLRGDFDERIKKQLSTLEMLLLARSETDLIKFYHIFFKQMNDAYRAALWGAAYLINGGCSDDTFMDFRAALIMLGKESFDAAIENPDSLARVIKQDYFGCEDMNGLAARVYKQKTGRDDFYKRYETKHAASVKKSLRLIGKNETWAEDIDTTGNAAKKLYPKLFKKFMV
jgi:Protein of unknown function (DUF4240)